MDPEGDFNITDSATLGNFIATTIPRRISGGTKEFGDSRH